MCQRIIPGYLEITIEENLEKFVALYGAASVLPKIHFLIHVPRLLERYVKDINTFKTLIFNYCLTFKYAHACNCCCLGKFQGIKNYTVKPV